jgi:hypothetical protein
VPVDVKPGARLRSAVSTAEVVVVRAPKTAVELCCGGAPMVVPDGVVAAAGTDVQGPATLLGKRYVDEETTLELLCTKTGAGLLTVDGRELALKGAKTLPSSD